jgi:hypothetical protein
MELDMTGRVAVAVAVEVAVAVAHSFWIAHVVLQYAVNSNSKITFQGHLFGFVCCLDTAIKFQKWVLFLSVRQDMKRHCTGRHCEVTYTFPE